MQSQVIQAPIVVKKEALKYAMAGIAAFCLGAAVFAAPMPAMTKGHIAASATQPPADVGSANFAPLSQGPAFQLGRAAPGEEEDCVKVTRIVGPDGRVYVTRGLICQE